MYQSTIVKNVTVEGIGLHSGNDVKIKFQNAPAHSGIVFFLHTDKGIRSISPRPDVVSTTALATTLSDGDASVSTVEHVLAALQGLEIDNVFVHVFGNEIPIVDGSAYTFVQALKNAGRKVLPYERKYATITKPITFAEEGKSITARRHDGFFIDYTIDFPHHSIGKQRFAIEITPDTFSEIANARTFGFLREVEYMHSKGLALGGSLANAIVLDEEGVVNPDGLRYPDEFVRHKVLDFVGDMAMLGLPLRGAFEVKCSGHKHNNLFLRQLQVSHSLSYVGIYPHIETRRASFFEPIPDIVFTPEHSLAL